MQSVSTRNVDECRWDYVRITEKDENAHEVCPLSSLLGPGPGTQMSPSPAHPLLPVPSPPPGQHSPHPLTVHHSPDVTRVPGTDHPHPGAHQTPGCSLTMMCYYNVTLVSTDHLSHLRVLRALAPPQPELVVSIQGQEPRPPCLDTPEPGAGPRIV